MELNSVEILALRKALVFLKYRCKSIDDTGLIVSPIINGVLEKCFLNMDSEFDFFVEKHSNSKQRIIDTIKANLSIFYEWNTYSDKTKFIVIRDLISPYKVDDSTIITLIEEGDKIHFEG